MHRYMQQRPCRDGCFRPVGGLSVETNNGACYLMRGQFHGRVSMLDDGAGRRQVMIDEWSKVDVVTEVGRSKKPHLPGGSECRHILSLAEEIRIKIQFVLALRTSDSVN